MNNFVFSTSLEDLKRQVVAMRFNYGLEETSLTVTYKDHFGTTFYLVALG